jgi:hypothetical protein
MRSDGFRVFAGLPRSPDRSAAPVRIFAYGWVITFVPMLIMFALGSAIAWAL